MPSLTLKGSGTQATTNLDIVRDLSQRRQCRTQKLTSASGSDRCIPDNSARLLSPLASVLPQAQSEETSRRKN